MRHLLLSLIALLGLAGPAMAEPLRVVTSFSILADLVAQVGGDAVTVRPLVGPDADAHVYEPTPADARALAEAQLLVVNGLGFEGWIDRLIKAAGYKGTVVVVSRGILPLSSEGDEHGHGHGGSDPHAWQDVANARAYVATIASALTSAAPAGAPVFAANSRRYSEELLALDGWIKQQVASVPAEKRRVISSHDAFSYFSRTYGVQFLAPVGISTEAEPSAGDVARLVRQIKASKVRALFIENMTDPRLVAQLAKDTGAVVGGALYADALSGPQGPAPTYVQMMRHNTQALVAAMAAN